MNNSQEKKSFWSEEKGEFGLKQIAMTVAIIIILGFVISAFKDKMPDFVKEAWDMIIAKIKAIT